MHEDIDIDLKKAIELRHKNVAVIFRKTAVVMIISELTGVIAVLIDGIITSKGLGVDVYSGISLLRPFTSVILMIAGFFSTGCGIVCSRLIGVGKKKEANEAFNLSSFLSLAFAALLIILCLCTKEWTQVMFLPNGFGGKQSDNLYAEIWTLDEAVAISKQTLNFCLQHKTDHEEALYTALFVEEMAGNVFEHAKRKKIKKKVCVDFRLFINEGNIYFSLLDLSDQFDPTLFYKIHQEDAPEEHIGIRMVTKMAKQINYYSTFKSNNLTVIV